MYDGKILRYPVALSRIFEIMSPRTTDAWRYFSMSVMRWHVNGSMRKHGRLSKVNIIGMRGERDFIKKRRSGGSRRHPPMH
jgi:hypothetical protein